MTDASDVSLDLVFQTHDSTANNVKEMYISTHTTKTSAWENQQKEYRITYINLNIHINPSMPKPPASLPVKSVSLTADFK